MPPPAAERGSATVTVATAAALLLLLLAVIAGAVGGITGQEASACTAQPAASGAATAIPANYLADFKAAGTRYGIPWTVLAAIGEVESGFGANDGPSSAGALGPMQFEPSTWAQYGNGGNINNPDDAIPAAARLLVANGAPGNLQQALLAYNDAGWYVTEVLNQAARYAAGGAQAAGDRGVLARRAAARQVDVATVTGLAIRDLTPGSVTVTATAAQVITGSSGTSRAVADWAVTLTPAGAGWLVWDIEPASAGNS